MAVIEEKSQIVQIHSSRMTFINIRLVYVSFVILYFTPSAITTSHNKRKDDCVTTFWHLPTEGILVGRKWNFNSMQVVLSSLIF